MAGETPPTTPPQETTPPPASNNGVLGGIDSLRFLTFLVHPDQRPFSEFDGEIPDKYRDMLYGLAKTAEQFGFNADMNGDVSAMINDLNPSQIIEILKGIDEEAFINLYEDTPEIRNIITELAQPLIESRLPDMTLAAAAAMVGDENIRLEAGLGELKVSDALGNSDNFQATITRMSDDDVLTLLESLPEELKSEVLTELAKEENGDPIDVADLNLTGMTIQEAISARAEYGESTAGWFGIMGVFNDKASVEDSSIHSVYDAIRSKLPEKLSKTLSEKLANATDPNSPAINDSAAIDPKNLYEMLQAELSKDEGGSIATLLTEDRMASIKEKLNGIEDQSFLINLLPDNIKDEALFNKLRETMDNYGLLGPAGSILMQLVSFVIDLVEKVAPGIIGEEKTANIVDKLQGFVSPDTVTQPVVEPPPMPANNPAADVTVTQGTVPDGGSPAVITPGR